MGKYGFILRWILGPLACRIWVALDVVCCTASIVTLCLISLDRCLGVHHPLRYNAIVTRKRLYLAASLIWLFSISVRSSICSGLRSKAQEQSNCSRSYS